MTKRNFAFVAGIAHPRVATRITLPSRSILTDDGTSPASDTMHSAVATQR